MNENRSLLGAGAIAGVVVCGALVYWITQGRSTGAQVQVPTTPAVAPAPQPPVKPASAPAPAAPKETGDPMLVMPDGTRVPPLNGVKVPGKLVWGDVPYSPIVRVEHQNNIDWYLHKDGTFTTTVMSWRSDLGRDDACTLCFHPVAPVGLDTESPPDAAKPGRKQ